MIITLLIVKMITKVEIQSRLSINSSSQNRTLLHSGFSTHIFFALLIHMYLHCPAFTDLAWGVRFDFLSTWPDYGLSKCCRERESSHTKLCRREHWLHWTGGHCWWQLCSMHTNNDANKQTNKTYFMLYSRKTVNKVCISFRIILRSYPAKYYLILHFTFRYFFLIKKNKCNITSWMTHRLWSA